MKKLILASILSLCLLSGCSSRGINTEYLNDLTLVLENTQAFESIELVSTTHSTTNEVTISQETYRYLCIHQPTMGYLERTSGNSDNYNYQGIFIQDENILGELLNIAYSSENEDIDPIYALLPTDNFTLYSDGEFNLPLPVSHGYQDMLSDTKYADLISLEKTNTGYTLSFTEDYFINQKVDLIADINEEIATLPADDENIDYYNDLILQLEHTENQENITEFVIEDGILKSLTRTIKETIVEISSDGTPSGEKSKNINILTLEIIRFNDNNNIKNEIQSIADYIQ